MGVVSYISSKCSPKRGEGKVLPFGSCRSRRSTRGDGCRRGIAVLRPVRVSLWGVWVSGAFPSQRQMPTVSNSPFKSSFSRRKRSGRDAVEASELK